MLLNGDIKNRGVLVPVEQEVYAPILLELKKYGIHFIDKQII